ncbi:MAG: phosphoglycerate kinase [Proteobacteria bacterium]|nr:phosphoglycerate kinase [Pseudomonadota bacterium]MDA0951092.1 phosphoglycerate kinase [Pseudomonadota bacterium]
MTAFATLDDLDVKGRRVLVRLDLNVPMKDGRVTDTTRIERAMPTVVELADAGACVVILSHFDRPKGKVVPAMSLAPIAAAVAAALDRPVAFVTSATGAEAAAAVDALADGGIAMLENLRFDAGEEANDPAFADALAGLGDLYVNDAFSAAHRAHASVVGLAERLPAAAGRLMEQELTALQKALGNPERPVAAVVGGAKVSTKLDLLGNLVGRVDVLAIGGGMANTFLYAQGKEIGASLCERDMADTARAILDKAAAAGCTIVLPVDGVVAEKFESGTASQIVSVDAVRPDRMILDVGPDSAADLARRLAECRTLVWNGPLGAFELEGFDHGTNAVARAAAALTREGRLLSVAGGGDTVAALAHAGVLEAFSYVSTAGGAFLEWLEGKTLPGVAALEKAAG